MTNPYQDIQRHLERTKLLLGMDFEQFEQLVRVARHTDEQHKAAVKHQKTVSTSLEEGTLPTLSMPEQICICLLYLRQMPIFELLGVLFNFFRYRLMRRFSDNWAVSPESAREPFSDLWLSFI